MNNNTIKVIENKKEIILLEGEILKKDLKCFFEELKNEKANDYFLLKKLYLNPKSFFYKTEKDFKNGDYYDVIVCNSFILNNNFLEFLKLALYDLDYINKLDYYMLVGISHLLDDSIFLTTDKCKFFIKIISINLFSKSQKIDDNFIDTIKNYNVITASNLMHNVSGYIKTKKDKEVTPIECRKQILDLIKNDDYSDPEDCILFLYEYNHINIINSVVCDNEFLNFLEDKLIDIDLNYEIINNIIKILNLSIDLNINKEDYIYEPYNIVDIVGIDRINKYNIDKAKTIISVLNNKLREKKIIYFHKKLYN